jgi:serine/threonine protein kinase
MASVLKKQGIENSSGHRIADGIRLGPYQITGFIGAGGMGEVYRAHDSNLNRVVALKLLPIELACDPDLLARFEEEARLASSLSHPAVVTIYEAGQIGSQPYISMELVSGETLREVLSVGALPLRRALRIGGQVAEGLAKAHEAGLVHRDLKPENIRVSLDGFAKILDIGLAKRISPLQDHSVAEAITGAETTPGTVLGTSGYMSPEQAGGDRADARSDQFSFGVVLYEMLTGQRAFHRRTVAETLSAIIRDEPMPLARLNAAVPPPVRWIVERCLAKDPADRYGLTRDLARDLASVREHLAELLVSKRSRSTKRASGHTSIAVLPVIDLSAHAKQLYLADSMTDALITELTGFRELQVISRVSSMTLKDQRESLPEIGEKLGVDWILLGSVARAGSQIRVTAQLVNAASDENRWAQSYARRPRNILNMLAETASAIAQDVQRALQDETATGAQSSCVVSDSRAPSVGRQFQIDG